MTCFDGKTNEPFRFKNSCVFYDNFNKNVFLIFLLKTHVSNFMQFLDEIIELFIHKIEALRSKNVNIV